MSGHNPWVQWVGEVLHLAAMTPPAPHMCWPCLTMYKYLQEEHIRNFFLLLALSKFKNRRSSFLLREGAYSDYCQTWSPCLHLHTTHVHTDGCGETKKSVSTVSVSRAPVSQLPPLTVGSHTHPSSHLHCHHRLTSIVNSYNEAHIRL